MKYSNLMENISPFSLEYGQKYSIYSKWTF